MANAVDEMTERMIDDVPIGACMRVVDIGCGPALCRSCSRDALGTMATSLLWIAILEC
jgi:predicted TPR repeat methyltransferase